MICRKLRQIHLQLTAPSIWYLNAAMDASMLAQLYAPRYRGGGGSENRLFLASIRVRKEGHLDRWGFGRDLSRVCLKLRNVRWELTGFYLGPKRGYECLNFGLLIRTLVVAWKWLRNMISLASIMVRKEGRLERRWIGRNFPVIRP